MNQFQPGAFAVFSCQSRFAVSENGEVRDVQDIEGIEDIRGSLSLAGW